MDASINERLTIVADKVRELSPPFAEAVDRLVKRLQESGAGLNAPRPGEAMPDFMLPDETGRLVELADLLAAGPVAVVFNRGHWCPYCRLNTVALAEANAEAEASGGRIVAITPERQQFTAALKAWAKAPFPILTDMDNAYALSLGLAIWVGGEVDRYMAVAGVNLPAYQGNPSWMLPIPATFIVGADGLIRERYVDPDYRQRMAIEDLLAALKNVR
jgi:peroxiredoxin